MSIRLNVNPLEIIGVNPLLVKRFCAENGVGLKDLSKLVQTISRHASTPFHTDRNNSLAAEQIFTSIQQAASDIDDEAGLRTAVEELLQRPADQIEELNIQFNSRLALLEQKVSETEKIVSSMLNAAVLGDEMFEAPLFRTRRFCISPPKFNLITQASTVNFTEVFDHNILKPYEYFINDNGDLQRYKLKRYKTYISSDKIKTYKPEPYEVIFDGIFTPDQRFGFDYIDEETESKASPEKTSYDHFYREEGGEILSGIRIIGSISIQAEKLDEVFKEALGLLNSSNTFSRDNILRTLTEGFTIEQFKPFLSFYSSNPESQVLLASNLRSNEIKIIPLGASFQIHKKTPHLFRRGGE